MDAPIDLTRESSGGNNSRVLSEAFAASDTDNLTEIKWKLTPKAQQEMQRWESLFSRFLVRHASEVVKWNWKKQSNLHTR